MTVKTIMQYLLLFIFIIINLLNLFLKFVDSFVVTPNVHY